MPKLPISAMIVGYNEEKFLPACLASINFCDEILYIDLGSNDDSLKIASLFTDKIFKRDKVPSGEYIQSEIVHFTKNDWVIFIDPDEVVDTNLQQQIINEFNHLSVSETIGAVSVPWHFYFNKQKLKGTIWGGSNSKHFLVNKHRYQFLPITHYGRKLIESFESFEIPLNLNKSNILHHYWMNSYKVFIKKHQRYLKNEGKDEYDRGRRTTLKKILLAPGKEFYLSFITKQGFKDNMTGFFLSLFWAYYKTSVYIGIYRIQKRILNKWV